MGDLNLTYNLFNSNIKYEDDEQILYSYNISQNIKIKLINIYLVEIIKRVKKDTFDNSTIQDILLRIKTIINLYYEIKQDIYMML